MAEETKTVDTTEPEAEVSIEELKAELERLKSENGKLKNATTNASADAAKWKKEAREKMDAQARAEAETKELIEQLKAENERMKHEQEVAVRTADFAGMGFDADLAKQAAESFGGDHADFVSALKTFLDAHDKALLADQLRSTPRPGNGGAQQTITKEQFDNMGYSERVKIFEEQPELYKELMK